MVRAGKKCTFFINKPQVSFQTESRQEQGLLQIALLNQSSLKQTLDKIISSINLYMLDLRDLIIDRIQQADSLYTFVLGHSLGNSASEATAHTALTLRQFSKERKREKQRIKREQQLLEGIKPLRFYHNSVAQNFYYISLAIFTSYDSTFLSLLTSGQPTNQRLQQLYNAFISCLPSNQRSKQLSNAVNVQTAQSSPFILMSWVCEWSRSYFSNRLQSSMDRQLNHHKEQPRATSLTCSNIPPGHKQKYPSNHLTMSAHSSKQEENTPHRVAFTNKESVYSYFIDNLSCSYKSLPLDLDVNFLKSIRKALGRNNQFERQDNLQRAAEVLIECKNKNTKEQVDLYRKQYYTKYPKKYKAIVAQQIQQISPFRPSKKNQKKAENKFFDRIKSQTKEEEERKRSLNRNSYLLCPKTNQISFQSSKQAIKKMRKERQDQRFELPEIIPHRMAQLHSKSTANRTKPISSYLAPACSSLVGLDGIKYNKLGPKLMQFKQPLATTQKVIRKSNHSDFKDDKQQCQQNPERQKKKGEGDEFKRNRKLMLQLLREKNRYAYLQR